jgi:myo-inositol-1(or 4)-monophosphatase
MDLNEIGFQVIELAKKVGVFISNERKVFSKSKVESKGLHDFVSYVDKEAEKKIVSGLKLIIPKSGFIAEENTEDHILEDYLWIIDPLDGTTNFIHNLAPHSISIALQHKSETIFGLVYELGSSEMFYSWKDYGVFCNENKIQISNAQHLSDGLIATGFHTNNFKRLPNQLKMVDQVVRQSHGIRRHGSAATDLAYVAAGRFDGFFETSLSVWDVAAGSFLIKQAGGSVSDYKGEENYLWGGEILVGTPGVHNDLLRLIKEIM